MNAHGFSIKEETIRVNMQFFIPLRAKKQIHHYNVKKKFLS
jgi:hypothetical protein